MGRKLDRFLGRAHRVSKFKPLISLAVSRLAVLRAQRHSRLSQSRHDVLQLLQLGHHERALLRVEQVIKEQNMLDAYDMMESYCNLLMERADLLEQEKECPEELKEVIASLIYASSRCGDFPELQEIRTVFASHFGREFVARAVELRNHCGVNLKMITKLSTRQPNWESRVKALKEIAAENSIALHLEDDQPSSSEDKTCLDKKPKPAQGLQSSSPGGMEGPSSDSFQMKKKYKDVADAAQAAFESAAHAAAAARAAVELSRSGSHDPDDHDRPDTQKAKSFHKVESTNKSEVQGGAVDDEHQVPDMPLGVNAGGLKQSMSSSSLEVEIDATSSEETSHAKEVIFDKSEDEREDEGRPYAGLPNQDDGKSKDSGKVEATPRLSSQKQIGSRFQAGMKMDMDPGVATIHAAEASKMRNARLNLEGRPFSVRSRQVRGY